jgi:hypothetical protein
MNRKGTLEADPRLADRGSNGVLLGNRFLAKQLAKAITGLREAADAFGVWGLIEIR